MSKLNPKLKQLRLDLGCGPNKKPNFIGVDCRKFDGVDVVTDLTKKWPWRDNTVEEVNCSHFIEHLTAPERIHFVNELYRVLKVGAKALVITPHWASQRAYGDLTHQWPPVSEMWFFYLNREWREKNAPHNDQYRCHFDATWGWSLHPEVGPRNQEFQQNAIKFYKEACQDTIATLTKL